MPGSRLLGLSLNINDRLSQGERLIIRETVRSDPRASSTTGIRAVLQRGRKHPVDIRKASYGLGTGSRHIHSLCTITAEPAALHSPSLPPALPSHSVFKGRAGRARNWELNCRTAGRHEGKVGGAAYPRGAVATRFRLRLMNALPYAPIGNMQVFCTPYCCVLL